jgi:hypothetical protein
MLPVLKSTTSILTGALSRLFNLAAEDRNLPEEPRAVQEKLDLVRLAIAQKKLGYFPRFLLNPFDGAMVWVEGETPADRATIFGFEGAGVVE